MTVLSLLLQIEEILPADQGSLSLLVLLTKGGYMMIPLIILWIIAIYIFIERILVLKHASKTPENFQNDIREKVQLGAINEAKLVCSKVDTPVARMIEKGISRIGANMSNIEASIENIGKIDLNKLEKNLSLLATIAGAAPMIGFLGTVTGMIQAFISIAQEEGAVSPKLLSNGIYEAMITTSVGLFVGIIAYLGYNYLVTRVQKLVHNMEFTSIDFIELLQEPKK